jgi:flagellar basal-body rod protein FlgG
MIDSLYIGATGMQAQQLHVDVIANNLANVNTAGFKKNRISFEDTFYQAATSLTGPNDPTLDRIMLGMGTIVSSNTKLFTQGELKASDSALDLAIRGNGFFEVLLPDGSSAYTRHGAFKITENGMLGTHGGHELKQQIQIPSDITEIVIDNQGRVSGRTQGSSDVTELGQIELVNFANLDAMDAIGENLFVFSDKAGQPITGLPGSEGLGTVAQKFLETSNVKLADEMVNLVLAQRAYELNSKVVQASDEMMAISNNLRR